MKKYVTADGLRAAVGSVLYKWLKKNKDRLHGWFKKPKPKHTVTSILMYDDINVSLIPKDAKAIAGYTGGRWPTYAKVVAGWPHAKHVSIAVSSLYSADCLDVEPGDATIDQAAAWVKKQNLLWATEHHDVSRPVLYTSASWGQKLVDACSKAGLRYGKDYLWWSAHYDPARGKHLCGPKCGFGLKVQAHATQWTDKAFNRSLDESFCSPGFFK